MGKHLLSSLHFSCFGRGRVKSKSKSPAGFGEAPEHLHHTEADASSLGPLAVRSKAEWALLAWEIERS